MDYAFPIDTFVSRAQPARHRDTLNWAIATSSSTDTRQARQRPRRADAGEPFENSTRTQGSSRSPAVASALTGHDADGDLRHEGRGR